MTRLVLVELRRLTARRLTRGAGLALVALLGLSLYGTQQQVWEATPERVAQVQAENLRICLESQTEARQSDASADFGCDSFTGTPTQGAATFVDVARSTVSALAYLLAFLAFAVGATFVAAEFSTGAIGMWLTYEPRRGRVYASKLTALLGGVLVVSALTLGIAVAATFLLSRHYGIRTSSPGAGAEALWGVTFRTLGLVGVVALVSAAVATLLRSTAATFGVLIGYLVVVELLLAQVLRDAFGDTRPWLIVPNTTAWLQAGLLDDRSPPDCFDPASTCAAPTELISSAHAGTYLLLLCVAAVAIGALVFRRRDVT